MCRFLKIAVFLLASCATAFAQSGSSVRQSGFVTPGHNAKWTTNGIIQDGGAGAGNGTVIGPSISTPGDLALWSDTVGSVLADGGGGSVNGAYTWNGAQTYGSTTTTNGVATFNANAAFTSQVHFTNLSTGTQTSSLCKQTNNLVIIATSANCFGVYNVNARVNLGSTNWTFTTPSPNQYVLIPFSTVTNGYNNGSAYIPYPGSYSTATPPANTIFQTPVGAKEICFYGSILVLSGASPTGGHTADIKLIKDFSVTSAGIQVGGVDVGSGPIITPYYGLTGSGWATISVCDFPAAGNDWYGLFIYIEGASGSSGGDTIVVDHLFEHSQFTINVVY